jgi:chromosome segregation ATPase
MEVKQHQSQPNESIANQRSVSAPRRNTSHDAQKGFLLDRCDRVNTNNNNKHRGSWAAGFFAGPPKRNHPSLSSSSTARKEDVVTSLQTRPNTYERKLLQQAEELVRLILQDEQLSINEVTLQHALSLSRKQLSTSLHKMKYSYILEKPWRTTGTDHSSKNWVQEKITKVEIANPKNFRKLLSVPKQTPDGNSDEKQQSFESLKDQLEHQKRQCHKLREKLKIVLMGSDERELEQFLNEFTEEENDDYLDSVHTEAYEKLQKQLQTTQNQLQKAQRQLQEADITAASTSYENDLTVLQSLKVELAVAQAKAEMEQRKLEKLEQEHHEYIQSVSEKLMSVESDADKKLQKSQAHLLEIQCQLEDTQMEIKNHPSRIQSLQERIVELQKELEMTHETLNQDVLEKHALQERINQLENEHMEHQKASTACIHAMQSNLDSVQQELNTANRKLEASSENYMNEINKLSQELEISKSFRQAVEQESQRLKEANANHENQIEVLQRSLLDANMRNGETEHDLTAKARENELLSEEIRESEAHIAQLLDELQVLQPFAKDLEVAESELEIAKQTISELRQKIQKEEFMSRIELETSENMAAARMEQMEAQHDAQVDEWRKNLEVAQAKNEQLTLALEEVQKASIERQQQREEEASRKIADIQSETSHLREQLEQKEQEMLNLKTQIEDQSSHLNAIREELEGSQSEKNRLIQKIEHLSSTRESSSSLLEAKRHKLEELLRRKEISYQNLQSELSQQSLQYRDVQRILKDAQAKNDQLSEEIRELKSSHETANNLVMVAEAQGRKLQDQSSRKDQQIQNLLTKIDEQTSKYKDVCQRLESTLSENAKLLENVAQLQSSAKSPDSCTSTNKIKELEDILTIREREINRLQSEVDYQQHQIVTFTMRIEALEEEQHFSRTKIQELSKTADHKNDESTRLLLDKTLECAELMAEHDALQKKLHILETKEQELEIENRQKAALIQSLFSSMSLTASPSQNGALVLERFQNERERVMKRTTDLSIQLAESQLKIDQLTEQLRSANRTTSTRHLPPPEKPPVPPSTTEPHPPVMGRRSFSARTFSNLFQEGLIGGKIDGKPL